MFAGVLKVKNKKQNKVVVGTTMYTGIDFLNHTSKAHKIKSVVCSYVWLCVNISIAKKIAAHKIQCPPEKNYTVI